MLRADKVILLGIVIFTFNSTQGNEYFHWTEERTAMPDFPVPSLRMKSLGNEFFGIISDLETDIQYFPSLLPLLNSSQIGIIFTPFISFLRHYPITYLCHILYLYKKPISARKYLVFQIWR